MSIASYTDFLHAARTQDQPQRLLFVFAAGELPEQADAAQRAAYAAGHGGAIAPLMCVDKSPDELSDFAALREEAEGQRLGRRWQLMFAASLSGRGGQGPGEVEIDRQLHRMVEGLRHGRLQGLLAFDREGELLVLR
ncbi:hypothetical protein [Chitinimonas koreensis]|uniref:hypothetical protein n=1 Tax=Chitinimonas koreensis TaxID=356302 RepID=UPI0004157B7E|nr:hypothetical protein [Chitinimonas koreensis]